MRKRMKSRDEEKEVGRRQGGREKVRWKGNDEEGKDEEEGKNEEARNDEQEGKKMGIEESGERY